MQVVLSNTPFGSSEVKLTLPVGLTVGLGPVSVTVAVQVDGLPADRMSVGPLPAGKQEIVVVVVLAVTVSISVPELAANGGSLT